MNVFVRETPKTLTKLHELNLTWTLYMDDRDGPIPVAWFSSEVNARIVEEALLGSDY